MFPHTFYNLFLGSNAHFKWTANDIVALEKTDVIIAADGK